MLTNIKFRVIKALSDRTALLHTLQCDDERRKGHSNYAHISA